MTINVDGQLPLAGNVLCRFESICEIQNWTLCTENSLAVAILVRSLKCLAANTDDVVTSLNLLVCR